MTPPIAPAPSELAARIAESLGAFTARRRGELAEIGKELLPAMDVLDGLLSGGKRLRPAFCYWAWRGAGGAPEGDAAIVAAAASLELLQASALVHDDVMDGSDTRRGRPAAHRALAALHRENGWRSDPAAFGVGGAILLGDLCLAWSDAMFTGCGLPPETVAAARPVYDAMRTELMCGQYLDLAEQARGLSSVESALHVVRYKSAKYTVERPLHIGAALAGRTDLAEAYTAFGMPLGIAFQLRDDVLGVFGDPAETGKPAGDDLREGKRTVLVAAAMERASRDQSEILRARLGDPALDTEGVAVLREIIRDTGGLTACESLIDRYASEAETALSAAPITDDARAALSSLAVAATSRRS
ncbi:MAG TPA: polyprenyl synthetase family protein [Streptosporangiaceae bacterium]|jgi:geranylgeranyl diphosphate synthase type I